MKHINNILLNFLHKIPPELSHLITIKLLKSGLNPQNFINNYKNLNVGDNKPYSGRMKNDTLYRHGTKQGIANILIEIRQDLISESVGQLKFSKLISEPLLENNNNISLFKKKIYKSFVD